MMLKQNFDRKKNHYHKNHNKNLNRNQNYYFKNNNCFFKLPNLIVTTKTSYA